MLGIGIMAFIEHYIPKIFSLFKKEENEVKIFITKVKNDIELEISKAKTDLRNEVDKAKAEIQSLKEKI